MPLVVKVKSVPDMSHEPPHVALPVIFTYEVPDWEKLLVRVSFLIADVPPVTFMVAPTNSPAGPVSLIVPPDTLNIVAPRAVPSNWPLRFRTPPEILINAALEVPR